MKVAVLGAGSWGTALANVFADNSHSVTLWGRSPEIVEDIRRSRCNPRYLPDVSLNPGLTPTTDLEEALANSELVLFAVPSASAVTVARTVRPLMPDGCVIAHAIKGFDLATRRRMSQVLHEELEIPSSRIGVLSGPSHAEEVVRRQPTTIVSASSSAMTAQTIQDALMNDYFRVYTNPDVIGTELGGSLKNIIALGVGIADGLGVGDNARAALMTRGLAEMARLGTRLGASLLTFAGLSGVGDLIVTCTSIHSRNFRTGRLLGLGVGLEDALKEIGMAVEGIPTTHAALELASENQVEMPITRAIHDVLYEDKRPADAVSDLMGRERRHEMEEVAQDAVWSDWKP